MLPYTVPHAVPAVGSYSEARVRNSTAAPIVTSMLSAELASHAKQKAETLAGIDQFSYSYWGNSTRVFIGYRWYRPGRYEMNAGFGESEREREEGVGHLRK